MNDKFEVKKASVKDITDDMCEKGIMVPESHSFDSLANIISERTLKAIKDMKYENMTEIQYKTVIPLLSGRDLLGAAKTGSGKTLAFLIPAVEMLHKKKFKPSNGCGVVVLSPTRELAFQIYGVLRDLMKYHTQTYGLIMGGSDRNTEAYRLSKGVNILISTPGRLMDHLQGTKEFYFEELFMLIIDEADRIMEIGFEEELNQIIRLLPKKRQTIMFSATQTQHVQDLAKVSLKNTPLYIGVDDDKLAPTVDSLQQGFIIVPPEKRLVLLYTFIKRNPHKKIMIFFSSCNSVQFHSELFNYIDVQVYEIHGKQKQQKRTSTFIAFTAASEGILLCTDVAARGLDIPSVDWIVQYDPPDDPKEYIHRVGRTARGITGKGHAVLFLLQEELGLVHYLQSLSIPITEYDFSKSKICDIQYQLEKLIETNYHLNNSATLAFKSYFKSYSSHANRGIFDVNKLDISKICHSFGFKTPPCVSLDFSAKRRRRRNTWYPKPNAKGVRKSKIKD